MQGRQQTDMFYRTSGIKPRVKDKPKVTFRDVAGADEAKQSLEEVLEFLKNPRKFREMGARMPSGVLLYGPPGTGKTLLARALAGEAGVPFFSISASEFVEMFVGVGASRVRDLFKQARKSAPSIVFIDEIDAVGRERGTGVGGGHDEREQTLNQLLIEMDGYSVSKGIIVIAATNRPDILDPALLRAGRFDRRIIVDRPDVKGRLEILKVHTVGKPLASEVDLEVIARRTPGFTGSDLGNLVNEATLLAIRFRKNRIEMEELEEAVELVIAGPERKSRVISEKDKRIIAYHEAGHVLISMLLTHTDPVHKVSIIQRGRVGGYTLTLPKEDRYYITESELLDQLKILLGGRVAEALVLGEITTGAQNDLKQVTEIARKMVCDYGMSEVVGPITFGQGEEQVFLGRDIAHKRHHSEDFISTIDQEIRKIVGEAYGKTEGIIRDHIDQLHRIAGALIEKETLEGKEVKQLLSGNLLPGNR
jgi:cell division protease FtsH